MAAGNRKSGRWATLLGRTGMGLLALAAIFGMLWYFRDILSSTVLLNACRSGAQCEASEKFDRLVGLSNVIAMVCSVLGLSALPSALVAGYRPGPARRLADRFASADDVAQRMLQHWNIQLWRMGLNDPKPIEMTWRWLDGTPPSRELLNRSTIQTSIEDEQSVHAIPSLFRKRLAFKQLVILGDPGIGKTTIAIDVTKALLERRERRPKEGARIPVLMEASDWNATTCSVEEHLARVLQDQWGIRATPGQARQLYFPVMDGLDEMAPESMKAAIQRIRHYSASQGEFILTSRTLDYLRAAQGAAPSRAVVICLESPSIESVISYLTPDSNRMLTQLWSPVVKVMRADPFGPLANTLRVPLLAWIARNSSVIQPPPRSRPLLRLGALALELARNSVSLFKILPQKVKRIDRDPFHPDQLLAVASEEAMSTILLDSYLDAIYQTIPDRPSDVKAKMQVRGYNPKKAQKWFRVLAQGKMNWRFANSASPMLERTSVVGSILVLTVGIHSIASWLLGRTLSGGGIAAIAISVIAPLVEGMYIYISRPPSARARTIGVVCAVSVYVSAVVVTLPRPTALYVIAVPIGGASFAILLGLIGDRLRPARPSGYGFSASSLVGIWAIGTLVTGVEVYKPMSLFADDIEYGILLVRGWLSLTSIVLASSLMASSIWPIVGPLVNRIVLTVAGALPVRVAVFLRDAHLRGALRASGRGYQVRHRLISEHIYYKYGLQPLRGSKEPHLQQRLAESLVALGRREELGLRSSLGEWEARQALSDVLFGQAAFVEMHKLSSTNAACRKKWIQSQVARGNVPELIGQFETDGGAITEAFDDWYVSELLVLLTVRGEDTVARDLSRTKSTAAKNSYAEILIARGEYEELFSMTVDLGVVIPVALSCIALRGENEVVRLQREIASVEIHSDLSLGRFLEDALRRAKLRGQPFASAIIREMGLAGGFRGKQPSPDRFASRWSIESNWLYQSDEVDYDLRRNARELMLLGEFDKLFEMAKAGDLAAQHWISKFLLYNGELSRLRELADKEVVRGDGLGGDCYSVDYCLALLALKRFVELEERSNLGDINATRLLVDFWIASGMFVEVRRAADDGSIYAREAFSDLAFTRGDVDQLRELSGIWGGVAEKYLALALSYRGELDELHARALSGDTFAQEHQALALVLSSTTLASWPFSAYLLRALPRGPKWSRRAGAWNL